MSIRSDEDRTWIHGDRCTVLMAIELLNPNGAYDDAIHPDAVHCDSECVWAPEAEQAYGDGPHGEYRCIISW